MTQTTLHIDADPDRIDDYDTNLPRTRAEDPRYSVIAFVADWATIIVGPFILIGFACVLGLCELAKTMLPKGVR